MLQKLLIIKSIKKKKVTGTNGEIFLKDMKHFVPFGILKRTNEKKS